MSKLDTSRIITKKFPLNQYYQEIFTKKQIVLHWTAGHDNVDGIITDWIRSPEHIATCVIISRNGMINQLYSSKHWAHHIGSRAEHFAKFKLSPNNTIINKQSIGIENCSFGPLAFHNGFYYTWVGTKIPASDVHTYEKAYRALPDCPFFDKIGVSNKPAYHYHKITDKQIASMKMLIEYWGEHYNIPLDYHEDIWTTNKRALSGEKGVFVHGSFRPDKCDLDPQPAIIEMLKSLKK